MNAAPSLRIEAQHVNALLELLDRHAADFLTEEAASGEVWRLFFVDADLLSVYANGRTKDQVNAWSSLLSLVSTERGVAASAEAEALSNVTGQAIVRYLFGALLRTLELQRGRVYITPEHEREFKGIVHAILRTEVVESGWLEALRLAYVEMGDLEGSPDTAVDAASRIVKTLEANIAAGASDRAYALLRHAVSTLSTNLIVVPAETRGSALFSTSDGGYQSIIQENRLPVWQAFEQSLRKRIDDVEELFALKKFVFDLHDAETGAERPFAFFANRVKAWVAGVGAPAALARRRDLDAQIRIAVRQAADLSALARINSLGQWLQVNHRPPRGKRWEMVLVSGSGMLARTVENWSSRNVPCMVSIVHPLNMLRHVDFWDPAGTRRLGAAGYLDQPHEFALSRIFGGGSRKGDRRTTGAEVGAFVQSLQEQLEVVVAREAMLGDRSLRQLRAMLDNTRGFDRERFSEAVRDLVTQRFAQTYNRLTELFPGERTLLPASSLPSLDLPRSDSAMKFLLKVRGALAEHSEHPVEFDGLNQSLKEDRTGYSALLALATGYMARGHRWIPAAQTMAATATLLAKGRRSDAYPEGNEALYLEAFLLRMCLTLESDLIEFTQHHTAILAEARDTLAQWAALNPMDAEVRMGRHTIAPTRAQWVAYRYELEDNAGQVFCAVIRFLQSEANFPCTPADLEALAEQSLQLHMQGAGLADTGATWGESFEPSLWFCGIQAGLSTLQSWLLWSETAERTGDDRVRLRAFERRIEVKVRELWIQREKLGKVLPMLARIYAQRTGLAVDWLSGKQTHLADFRVRFAGIDEQRMRWLRDVLVAGSRRQTRD